jgi:hypothetical protein
MLKRLLIVLLILVGLAALADRFLARAAGDAAGAQIRRAVRTPEDADVRFNGFPFVTQAMSGHFESVDVTARDVPQNGLTVTRIEAHFTGVRINFSKALNGEVAGVPTDRARATVRISYDDLNTFLRRRPGALSVSGSGNGRAQVSGRIRVRGAELDASGTAAAQIRDGSVVLRVTQATAEGRAVPAAALPLLTVELRLPELPFGIALSRVTAERDGLVIDGTAKGLVIPTR